MASGSIAGGYTGRAVPSRQPSRALRRVGSVVAGEAATGNNALADVVISHGAAGKTVGAMTGIARHRCRYMSTGQGPGTLRRVGSVMAGEATTRNNALADGVIAHR